MKKFNHEERNLQYVGPMCMIVLFANFSQIISPHIRERIWFVQPYATSSVREHKYNTDMTSPQHALTTLVTCNICVKNSVHTLGHFCKRGGGVITAKCVNDPSTIQWRKMQARVCTTPLLNSYSDAHLQI